MRLQTRSLTHTRLDPGLALAGLLALFVVEPLLQPGLPGTADTPIHFYRTLELARSWGPGVIYPRWAPDLAYGYGYPLWNYVPPLPYLIALALHGAGLSLELSMKALVALAALSYALGAYLLVRDSLATGGSAAGLVAAAIYTLAPFALRETLLYGGNYPQYLAIGLYPWVLWALGRAQRRAGGRASTIGLTAVLYGAVVLTHLFHALVLTLIAVARSAAGVLWPGERQATRRLADAALGLGLGLLGTAFFWLPALVERAFTRFREDIFLSASPFSLRFLSGGELLAWPQALDARAANPWVPFSLGPAAIGLAVLGILALLLRISKAANQQISKSANQPIIQPSNHPTIQSSNLPIFQSLFFLALLAVSIFMMLPVSEPVWAHVPLLAIGEFPWRWLGVANLCLAYLGGASVAWRRRSASARAGTARAVGAALAVLAVLLSSAVYLYPARPFVRYGESVADMVGYERASQTIGTTTLGEYLPRWVETVPEPASPAAALARGDPVEKLDRASLPQGATARLLEHSAASDAYHFDSPQPFEARLLTFYFPGWTARLDGRPVPIVAEPGSGLMRVPIPAGAHELRLRFADTPLRTAANALSGLALVSAAAAALWRAARQRTKDEGPLRGTTNDHRPAAAVRDERPRSVPDPQPPAQGLQDPGWSSQSAFAIGITLVALLLFKSLVVDAHTGWFRRASPAGQVAGVEHPLRASLDERIWLLGYDLERERAAQGDRLRVVLYWQAAWPLTANYRSFVHLDAPTDQRTWAGSDNYHPGDATAQIELPTSTWDTAHYVRDEHSLRIPPGAPPVHFDLRAGLYDPETGRRLPVAGEGGDTVRLQAVEVTRGRGLGAGDAPNPILYQLGDDIRLIGYEWEASGDTLTLYWQAGESTASETRRASLDPVVFVHLLDAQGRLAWGSDGPLLGGLYPVSAWRPGEVVADPRPLSPGDLPPGDYGLAVGMYDRRSLARLPVRDAAGTPVPGDAIPLMRLAWP